MNQKMSAPEVYAPSSEVAQYLVYFPPKVTYTEDGKSFKVKADARVMYLPYPPLPYMRYWKFDVIHERWLKEQKD